MENGGAGKESHLSECVWQFWQQQLNLHKPKLKHSTLCFPHTSIAHGHCLSEQTCVYETLIVYVGTKNTVGLTVMCSSSSYRYS